MALGSMLRQSEDVRSYQLTVSLRHSTYAPEQAPINIDKSGANAAAIVSYNAKHGTEIHIRKCKYLNNVIEQDHRGSKRITGPMLGFKSFDAAQSTLALCGIELMRMIHALAS